MGLKSGRRSLPYDPNVDAWLAGRGPQRALMQRTRDLILSTDPRISECIKWSCPTFVFEGNLVSINPQAKKFVSLMFHTGGRIPGTFPLFTGSGATCKYVRIDDEADLAGKRASLTEIVRAWCAWKSG